MLDDSWNKLWALCLMCFVPWTMSAQTEITCDHRAYLSLEPFQEGAIPLFRSDPATNNDFEVFIPDAGVFLSCLGFSVNNYLYGLDPVQLEIYRVGSAGDITNLGMPDGLDTSLVYRAGTMAPDGFRMVLIGQSKETGFDEKFFTVRVDLPDLPAGNTSVISDDPTRIGDMAFDPYYGNAYGFDEYNQRLVNIGWPGGLVTSFNYETLAEVTGMGSLVFDSLGVLYGYGSTSSNSAETTLFTLNKIDGSILGTRAGPSGLQSDGCNCPYRIQLRREVEKQIVLPCEELEVSYEFWNRAGTVYTDISLIDPLPAGFEIVDILQVPFPGDFSQGIGGEVLSYDEFDLLLGKDTLQIKIKAPQLPGAYQMQAQMDPLPASFGYTVLSDDPLVPGKEDPNSVRVIGEGDIFVEKETLLCPGSMIRISTGLQSGDHLWSDGSTESWLEVSEEGSYWVEVSGPCGVYRDTIFVGLLPEPLMVDLGPDREIRIGSYLTPDLTTNAGYPLTLNWSTEGSLVSCTVCPLPTIGPILEDTEIRLSASNDTFGCADEDTLVVRVLKDRQIYMPNSFSPDADGVNDIFFPQSLEAAEIQLFRIADRWGRIVFESITGSVGESTAGWDGWVSGNQASSGIYIWYLEVEFQDGWQQQMSGDVLLIR